MVNLIYNNLMERLSRLDEDAALLWGAEERLRMVIVGGSALILMEMIHRATMDIDALEVPPKLRQLLEKYDINGNVQAFVNNFPYNYEDRLKPLPLKGRVIDFYTASLEDIVIAKLFSNRDTDRQDIIAPSILAALDWALLEKLALDDDEVRAAALNQRSYRDFLVNYQEYVERYRP